MKTMFSPLSASFALMISLMSTQAVAQWAQSRDPFSCNTTAECENLVKRAQERARDHRNSIQDCYGERKQNVYISGLLFSEALVPVCKADFDPKVYAFSTLNFLPREPRLSPSADLRKVLPLASRGATTEFSVLSSDRDQYVTLLGQRIKISTSGFEAQLAPRHVLDAFDSQIFNPDHFNDLNFITGEAFSLTVGDRTIQVPQGSKVEIKKLLDTNDGSPSSRLQPDENNFFIQRQISIDLAPAPNADGNLNIINSESGRYQAVVFRVTEVALNPGPSSAAGTRASIVGYTGRKLPNSNGVVEYSMGGIKLNGKIFEDWDKGLIGKEVKCNDCQIQQFDTTKAIWVKGQSPSRIDVPVKIKPSTNHSLDVAFRSSDRGLESFRAESRVQNQEVLIDVTIGQNRLQADLSSNSIINARMNIESESRGDERGIMIRTPMNTKHTRRNALKMADGRYCRITPAYSTQDDLERLDVKLVFGGNGPSVILSDRPSFDSNAICKP